VVGIPQVTLYSLVNVRGVSRPGATRKKSA